MTATVTYEFARRAADVVLYALIRNRILRDYIENTIVVRLRDVMPDCPRSEQDNYCIIVLLRKPLPAPSNIALRHDGIRVFARLRQLREVVPTNVATSPA